MSTFPKYGHQLTQKSSPSSSSSPNCFEMCAEIDALDILNQFRKLYERKLREIDCEGGGDCLEMKISIQQKWIEDLSEQTVMMASVIKELEQEAKERVQMLEEKLQNSAQAIHEVMKRYNTCELNSDRPLQCDCKSLIEFIRRIREEGKWSMDGLKFNDVTVRDLFGDKGNLAGNKRFFEKTESCFMKDAHLTVPTFSSLNAESTRIFDKNDEKMIKDNERIEELDEEVKKKNKEIEQLQQAMVDMRDALTEEVASKHDLILLLKKDIQELEERCIQADKQTAFKEDIIKELRKEVKHLKQQIEQTKNQLLVGTTADLGKGKKMESICCKCGQRFKESSSFLKEGTRKKQDLDLEENTENLEEKHRETENNNTTDDKEVEMETSQKLEYSSKNANCLKKIRNGTEIRRVSFEDVIVTPLVEEITMAACSSVPISKGPSIDTEKTETIKNLEKKITELEEMIKEKNLELEKMETYKNKCKELEDALQDSCGRAENLQKAVNLYLNSIEILEGSEERAKIEIEQQRITIFNLQEALVLAKQELDEFKQKSQQEVSVGWTARWFRQPPPSPPQNNTKSVHDI